MNIERQRVDRGSPMTVDPIEHYGVSPKIADAAMTVLENIAARDGSTLPSSDVIGKALSVLGGTNADGERGVSRVVEPAIVYRVPSASQPHREHLVALYLGGTSRRALTPFGPTHVIMQGTPITYAECSCEATRVCWHLLTALTLAENNGYSLETGS